MPVLNYDNSIPQATDVPSESQPLILENFESIQAIIEVNHVTFNDNDHGKHKFLTMPNQVASPNTGPAEGALWVAEGEPGISELFFRRQSNSGNPIPITSTNGASYTFLPSGILIKWGEDQADDYDRPITFPVAVGTPVFDPLHGVQVFITMRSLGNDALNSNKLATRATAAATDLGFRVNCFTLTTQAPTLVRFSYIAIGVGL